MNTGKESNSNRIAAYIQHKVGKLRIAILQIFAAMLLMQPCVLHGQTNYPVQASVMAAPPYSTSLQDYCSAGSQRLQVMLLLKDASRGNLPVRVRIRIEGAALRLSPKQSSVPPAIVLSSGVMQSVCGDALAGSLSIDALEAEGADAESYKSNGQQLRAGQYRIEAWAEETVRGTRVSNVAQTWIMTALCQPPLISYPQNKTVIQSSGIQNIMFQWIPRHLGVTSDAASRTYYKVRLYEIWPAGRNAEEVVRSSAPIYESMANNTILPYGISEPALVSGRSYALQVQALDADGRMVFENEGLSQAVEFTYGQECQQPQGLESEPLSPVSAAVRWTPDARHTCCTIAYRSPYSADSAWHEVSGAGGNAALAGLTEGTAYRVRVQGQCGTDRSQWTAEQSFATPKVGETPFECSEPKTEAITDRNPVFDLEIGNFIYAGDFKVRVLSAVKDGNAYSGAGISQIGFLRGAPAYLKFNKVVVNADHKLIGGSLVMAENLTVLSDSLVREAARLAGDVAASLKTSGTEVAEVSIPGTITSVPQSSAQGAAAASESKTIGATSGSVTASLGKNTKATDSAGNVVAVSQGGAVSTAKVDPAAFGSGGAAGLSAATGTSLPKVAFSASDSQKYGFDASRSGSAYPDSYATLEGAPVAWKSVAAGTSDAVTATADMGNSGLDAEKIRYRTADGLVVDSDGGETAQVKVQGFYSGAVVPVMAIIDTGKVDSLKRTFICGQVNSVGYDVERRRVWLVPINEAKIDKNAIASTLNDVYRQAVVEWDVQYDPSQMSLTLDSDQMAALSANISTSVLSNYTGGMKAALQKFGKEPEDDTFLMFVADATSEAVGFMPLNRSAGFIFAKGRSSDEIARTIAHELGHGAFGLEHVGLAAGGSATDNLMDYAEGTALDKPQWDAIHSEHRKLTWFQGEEEGKALDGKTSKFLCIKDSESLSKIKKYKYFYLPDGNTINLEGYTPSGFYTVEDVTKEAHGAVAAISVNSNNYGTIYIPATDNKKAEVTGYGYRVGENKLVTAVEVKPLLVSGNSVKPVGIFIDQKNNQAVVKREGNILETLTIDAGGCNLYSKPETVSHFHTDKVSKEYVKYAESNSIKIASILGEEADVIDVLVEKVKESPIDEDVIGAALADKLRTFKKLNNRNFIVVAAPVRTLCTSEDLWNEVTSAVFQKAGLQDGDVLITIPYVLCEGIQGVRDGKYYFMPGVAWGNSANVEFQKVESGYSNTQSFGKFQANDGLLPLGNFVLDVFKNTHKKSEVYRGIYLSTNLVQYEVYKNDDAVGLDFNRRLELYREKKYSELKSLIDNAKTSYANAKTAMYQQIGRGGSGMTVLDIANTLEIKKTEDEYAIANKIDELAKNIKENPDDIEVYIPVSDPKFREEFLGDINSNYTSTVSDPKQQTNAAQYIYTDAFADLRDGLGYGSVKDFAHDGDKTTFRSEFDYILSKYDNIVYGVLDGVSFCLGFVGADFISDGLGFIYAVVRKDAVNATSYGSSILIIGPEGVAVSKSIRVGAGKLLKVTPECEIIGGIGNASDFIMRENLSSLYKNGTGSMPKQVYDDLADKEGKVILNGIREELQLNGSKKAFRARLLKIPHNNDNYQIIWKIKLADSDVRQNFVNDFAKASDKVLKKFLAKPELVDAWKKLKALNADASVRLDIKTLETLADDFSDFPDAKLKTILEQKDFIKDWQRTRNLKKDLLPDRDLFFEYYDIYKNPKYYSFDTGFWKYPPIRGFLKETMKFYDISKGKLKFDRYGEEKGFFLGKQEDAWEKRSLPPHTKKGNYQKYEMTDNFPSNVKIIEGKIASWFRDDFGGGTQYLVVREEYSSMTAKEIIESGIKDEDLFYTIEDMKGKKWIKEVNN